MLAVTGDLSVEAGVFELAGGRIEAEDLDFEGMTWDVTLTPGQEAEGYRIVAGDAAVITDGVLVVRLADGFQPALDTAFTLLHSGTDIIGDAGGTWFGYQDGDEVVGTDGSLFRLDLVPGSESLQLTVIPEPGALTLLAMAGLLGLAVRRRR